MALPYGTTRSLSPAFAPARSVNLAVKPSYAFALYARLPTVLREPLEASVTLLEATTPVKLPTTHCSSVEVRYRIIEGWYFKDDSTTPSDAASKSPTYPTHQIININAKL